jgi:hypothetical protein
MQKLSALIFSKDDIEKAVDLIEGIYSIADEIVIIDSSNKRQKTMLLNVKNRLKLRKVRIFHAVALGYPDPLRMYALSKCRNAWVLLIDTDERLSRGLKHDIRKIILNPGCVAFDIKRYEGVNGGAFTWQTRLFRRTEVEFRGLLHEHAIVNGSVQRLTSADYYMEHRNELMKHNKMYEQRDYTDMRMFDAHPVLAYLPDIYLFLTSFSTDFLRSAEMLRKKRKEWTARSDHEEIREIGHVINKVGIIRFLGLEDDKVIEYLNRKYGNKQQGVQLLIRLLKNKYEGREL